MAKIRILIVDDAVVVRRVLTNLLSSDSELNVVGTSPNGPIALAKITQVNPDLVLWNEDMAEMEDQESLAAIRKIYPLMPVILFRRSNHRTAELSQNGGHSITMLEEEPEMPVVVQRLAEQLIPKIKRWGRSRSRMIDNQAALAVSTATPSTSISDPGIRGRSPVEIVAIGASTGGPKALTTLLTEFPANCPVPLVIVQHMPPVFTGYLADRLASRMAIGISEGITGKPLIPAHAWIAPGNYHMELMRDAEAVRVRLHQGPPENSCRPAVDVLFRSVAETYGPRALAVVLSGMGQDGLRGCERIREAGGQVLVQDEATSIVWGMPGFVARAGLADQVLPLDQLGPEIMKRVRRGRSLSFPG